MATPRLLVILIAGVVLLPAAFVFSRQAADAGSEPPPPAPVATPAKPAAGGGAKPAQPRSAKPKPSSPKPRTKADKVVAAVARRQTVVLMLSDGRGADHAATARAVRSLRGRPGVRVFSDRLESFARYRSVVGSLGVSQSPAVVIVGRDRKAQVVEGYVDAQTLRQRVRDAGR
jgi:hypothetical protein